MSDLREKLASLAHEQWSGWMRYLFEKCEDMDFRQPGGVERVVVVPTWAVERWKRQLATPYEALSDEEKESDRKEADRVLALVSEENARLAAEVERLRRALEMVNRAIHANAKDTLWLLPSDAFNMSASECIYSALNPTAPERPAESMKCPVCHGSVGLGEEPAPPTEAKADGAFQRDGRCVKHGFVDCLTCLAFERAELRTESATLRAQLGVWKSHAQSYWDSLKDAERQLSEAQRKAVRAEALEEAAQMFERELEEGLVGMTFSEWCEWIAARLREGKL